MKYKYTYGGALIGREEKRVISRIVDTNYWPWADEGKKFEEEAAKYLGVKHGIAANSGSSAGLLALTALELPKGSEVIIPATTFPTIFNIILQCGHIPVVVDSKIGTYNLDPDELEAAISKKTKAIICVHAVGNPVDMPAVMKIAKKHKLYVIEDNCLSGDTKIKTVKGDVLLRDIRVGDEVLTRKGYKKVLRHIDRGERIVMTKLGVTGTPDHPFITTNGVKTLDGLQPSDTLYTWNEKSSCIEERTITDILTPRLGTNAFTTGLARKLESWHFIARYGLTITGRFLKECGYTIKTEIHSIMNLPTSNLLHPSYTVSTTSGTTAEMSSPGRILPLQEKKLSYGMHLRQVASGIVNRALLGGKKERVYDLEVEDAHEFFANGILVHNCDGWGGSLGKKKVGSFGHVSFTSFHAAHIVAMGQGGGVFTNDSRLAKKIKMYRDWGRQADTSSRTNHKWKSLPKDYDSRFIYEKIGYNLSPLELQAAMGRVQLKKTEEIKRKRRANYEYLYEKLCVFPDLVMPQCIDNADPSWFALPLSVRWGDRGPLVAHLEKHGIETRSMFAGNILKHPAYKDVKCRSMKLDDANWILENSFWIGCHPRYGKKDIDYVVKVFKSYYAK